MSRTRIAWALAAITACSASRPTDPLADGATHAATTGGGGDFDGDNPACAAACAADGTRVVDCHQEVIAECDASELCASGQCMPACMAAQQSKASVGCEFYAVAMDGLETADGGCFVTFVANTFALPAHVDVAFQGMAMDVSTIAAIPQGSGQTIQYQAYDPSVGIAPGKVAILFLASKPGTGVPCPGPSAVPDGQAQLSGTGRGAAFRVTTDVPVVAYQMLPYGGGSAAVTGATLLLPTSAWDLNYIAVNAYGYSIAALTSPSMNVVAAEDDTTITLLPKVALEGGGGVPAAPANAPTTFALDAGEMIQISQHDELTGSPMLADKPIGVWAGHRCMNVPASSFACDHAEQQIPPVRALGSEYVAVSHRARVGASEDHPWRLVGAVDGTVLSYEPAVGGPPSLSLGEVVEFASSEPFVVQSQDEHHPFLLFNYMTGSTVVSSGYGDPDFVRSVPPGQYLDRYVFFTDVTYPETNLVVVRRHGGADVTLDCAGVLGGFTPIGASQYEYARVDLVRHDFAPQGGCNTGRREMSSADPFGLWVWGWGTPETATYTADVSYGYPAGERVAPINGVSVPPIPR
jgi:IgGFc binding protein